MLRGQVAKDLLRPLRERQLLRPQNRLEMEQMGGGRRGLAVSRPAGG